MPYWENRDGVVRMGDDHGGTLTVASDGDDVIIEGRIRLIDCEAGALGAFLTAHERKVIHDRMRELDSRHMWAAYVLQQLDRQRDAFRQLWDPFG